MTYKEQLNEAEIALWKIFNIISNENRSRQSKQMIEIRGIIKKYLDDKINIKEVERGDK